MGGADAVIKKPEEIYRKMTDTRLFFCAWPGPIEARKQADPCLFLCGETAQARTRF